MKTIAGTVDAMLYAAVALTVALILYKTLDLWFSKLWGNPLQARLGESEASLEEAIESLESGLPVLAVIAATAPFVGLAGTVMHIIEALRALGGAGVDISVISGPIATALNSTLIGLASAIPAVIAYNLMQRRIQLVHNRHLRALQK